MPQSAEESLEAASPVTIIFDEFSVEKTDIGEDVQVTIEAADASSTYPDLSFSLNGNSYILSSEKNKLTIPNLCRYLSVTVPAYLSGDFKLKASAKSIDGLSESNDNIPLNFTIGAVAQGSDVLIDMGTTITEATGLVPGISQLIKDTDGSDSWHRNIICIWKWIRFSAIVHLIKWERN